MLPKIGEILVAEKWITQDQRDHCLEYQKMNPKARLGSILKHHNFVNDSVLADCLSKQIHWKRFKNAYVPNKNIIRELGIDYFQTHQIFPLSHGARPAFVVSFIDEVEVTDFLKNSFGRQGVDFYIGAENEVRNALDLMLAEENKQKLCAEIELLKSQGMEALVLWLHGIIDLAILTRSTDIHIEPTGKTTDIRFRTDGLLVPITCLKPEYMAKLANIILTKCKGNPCDYTIQDGRFDHEFKALARVVDVRFAQVPTIHGPSIVLRLLDKMRASIPLESLGYSAYNQQWIDQALRAPHGLILVTGPTGSGKSTTLSALLNQIKSITKKIVTIEDPVEMTHTLMSQVTFNPDQNLTFKTAIRAFLRQDPDVIFIGEIRDRKTAQEALRAANTGLKIFSTLHTHDPVAAILRLKDLGVDAVNIASCLTAVISQRLVRKLCVLCKESYCVTKDALVPCESKYLMQETQTLYRAYGCGRCRHGYLGRTVVAEVLCLDADIKELIAKNNLGDIYALLRQRGTYRSMLEDMRHLLYQGETSMEEALRVLG